MIEFIFIGLYLGIAVITYSSISKKRRDTDITGIIKALCWPFYAVRDYVDKINKRD